MKSTAWNLFGRSLDGSEPPLIVAELSANHRQDLGLALATVEAARESGADVVKFQHFRAEHLAAEGDIEDLIVGRGSAWEGRRLVDLYREAEMPWEWTAPLASRCEEIGLGWFSSPFDFQAVDFLVEHRVQAIKIASFELVDLPLIRHAAETGLPLILSTGMASELEIEGAVSAASEAGNHRVVLLKCNSSYPAKTGEMNLTMIKEFRSRWGLPVGLSDHTTDWLSAVVSVGLGSCMIEKHFILDRKLGGPDAHFSLSPDEFSELARQVRLAHQSLGTLSFGPTESEISSLQFRRSLRATMDIPEGQPITTENVRSLRPSGGLAPENLKGILGRRTSALIRKGSPITNELLSSESSIPDES